MEVDPTFTDADFTFVPDANAKHSISQLQSVGRLICGLVSIKSPWSVHW